jgi:arylsulfatase A-like enzyme
MASPTTTATAAIKAANKNIIKSFVFVTDMTPTFLDFAKVPQPGATYRGNEVHPIMGKSIKPLLDGTVDRVHAINEPIGTELFNSTVCIWVTGWLFGMEHILLANGNYTILLTTLLRITT